MSSICADAFVVAVVVAILALAGCKELPPNTDRTSPNTATTQKHVLALQAFIDRESDERIMAICSGIENVEGYRSSLGNTFIPHITLASYLVTPRELRVAESQFSKRLTGLNCIQVAMTLQEEDEDGRLSYFLLPEPTKPLLQFHAQAHSKLGWSYEPYRQKDLPGKWQPHLTLFSIPKSQRPLISDALLKLRKVRVVTIERIGLLGFGPTSVSSEVRLEKSESSR